MTNNLRMGHKLWLAVLALGARTAFLALFGFPEPRYILELLPLTLVLAGIGLATPLRLLSAAGQTSRR